MGFFPNLYNYNPLAMALSDTIKELRSHLSYTQIIWDRLEEWKSRYKNISLLPNECMYLVSILDNAIIFQKGLDKLGFRVPECDCLLDVDFPYQFISEQDRADVEFISENLLNIDNFRLFRNQLLYVHFRGQRRNYSPLRFERACHFDVFDENNTPMGYLTIMRFFEKQVDLDNGVGYELMPLRGEINGLQHQLDQAYYTWKFAQCPVSLRELEVYNLYDKGYTTSREIGQILHLHKQTIDGYFKTAKQKLKDRDPHLNSKIEILHYLKGNGFLGLLGYADASDLSSPRKAS